MNIKGIENMTGEDIDRELRHGGRFVIFTYTISILVMTFRRSSDIHFVKGGRSAFGKGMGCSLVSLICGWWGIPWGPIYTIGSIFTNCSGGKDVTQDVVASLTGA